MGAIMSAAATIAQRLCSMVPFRIATKSEMQGDVIRIALTGGGSGGHVYPGLAVLEGLRRSTDKSGCDLDVVWIGGDALESEIVPNAGVRFARIPTGKLRRYVSFRNVTDLFRVIAGVFAAVSILRSHRAQVLFSKGGFVSVPAVFAARLCGIPVVSHESDADPGLATRINARSSSRLLVAYESVRDLLPERLRPRVEVSGNPIREAIIRGDRDRGFAIAGFGRDDVRPILLVLGGSQGATQLNGFIARNQNGIEQEWRIVHQCGGASEPLPPSASYFGRSYFSDELPDLLAAADLILCRSGAGTLWEGAACRKPLLMVPLVVGTRGDQIRNARLFEAAGAGAAVVTSGDESTDDAAIMDALWSFRDSGLRRTTGDRAYAFAQPGAVERIADAVLASALGKARRE